MVTNQLYTPGPDEVREAIKAFTVMPPGKRAISPEMYDRMIEALRAEERAKAAQIAKEYGSSKSVPLAGQIIAARILAQGGEQS